MKVPKMLSRKVATIERHVPPLEHAPLFLDHHRVQERRHREPGQEAGVLHRVPGPVAAPAQLDIGPPHAQRDADGEEEPRDQGPLPDGDDPAGVQPAAQQRRHGKGERDGDADVPEVEHRRVHDHADVLELRIEAAAVFGNERQPRERIGGEQHHRDEEHHHRGGHAGHVGQQVGVAPRRDPLRHAPRRGEAPRPRRGAIPSVRPRTPPRCSRSAGSGRCRTPRTRC